MIATRRIHCRTEGNNEVVNLTPSLQAEIDASGVKNGTVLVFVPHSTAGLTAIEYEPALVADFKEALDRLAPQDLHYRHNLTEADKNGHSHVRASLLGPSLAIPVEGGRMILGTWQQVVLVDSDVRPRSREVVVQISGE